MTYSYFPGCTLKNKAKDLDHYARECAKVLGFELELCIHRHPMKSLPNFLRFAP